MRFSAWALVGLTAEVVIARAWAQGAAAQNAVNQDAALVQEFQKRVAEYVNLHKSAEATLPPSFAASSASLIWPTLGKSAIASSAASQ